MTSCRFKGRVDALRLSSHHVVSSRAKQDSNTISLKQRLVVLKWQQIVSDSYCHAERRAGRGDTTKA